MTNPDSQVSTYANEQLARAYPLAATVACRRLGDREWQESGQ